MIPCTIQHLEDFIMVKKLKYIEYSGLQIDNRILFKLEDGSSLYYYIRGCEDECFLYNTCGYNSEIFSVLGINNPATLYNKLGIYKSNGQCPYCRLSGLEVLFKYLLDNYGVSQPEDVEFEEIVEKATIEGTNDEYDWLF